MEQPRRRDRAARLGPACSACVPCLLLMLLLMPVAGTAWAQAVATPEPPVQVRRLQGDEWRAAAKARDQADRLNHDYVARYMRRRAPQAGKRAAFERTVEAYRKVITQWPLTDQAGYCGLRLAGFLQCGGQHQGAVAQASEVAKQFRGTEYEAKAHLNIGLVYLQDLHRPAEAIKWFGKLTDPDGPGARGPVASRDYSEMHKLYSSARQQMAKSLVLLGRADEARKVLEALGGRHPRYKSHFDDMLKNFIRESAHGRDASADAAKRRRLAASTPVRDGAADSSGAAPKGKARAPTLADVAAIAPTADWRVAAKAVHLLSRITDTDSAARKAELLRRFYEALNTAENDRVVRWSGPPPMPRRVQAKALDALARTPTAQAAVHVRAVLADYIGFMNRQLGPVRPRHKLQLSMAALVRAHLSDAKVREIGKAFLTSSAIREWTKGRIAAALLRRDVELIKPEQDPDLSRRLAMIMRTACLPTLREMQCAPKRIVTSAVLLAEITAKDAEALRRYVLSLEKLTDTQKYFLAYALIYRAVRKVLLDKVALTSTDRELVEIGQGWRRDTAAAAAKAVEYPSDTVEQIAAKWAEIE